MTDYNNNSYVLYYTTVDIQIEMYNESITYFAIFVYCSCRIKQIIYCSFNIFINIKLINTTTSNIENTFGKHKNVNKLSKE